MQDLMKLAIIGLVLLTLLWFRSRTSTSTSTFTFQPFDGLKNVQEVTASFKTQAQQVAAEHQAELMKAKIGNKSKEEMIAISDKFNDHTCELSKAFSRWNINNSM